jgi:hypothetical protein
VNSLNQQNKTKKLPDKRSSIPLIAKQTPPHLTSPKSQPRLEHTPSSRTILRKLPYEQGFHFYTTFGQYTGITATSLHEFQSKLKIVDEQSILFHYSRDDFQKWIQKTLKDQKLATRIDITKSNLSSKNIREKLLSIINSRLKEL